LPDLLKQRERDDLDHVPDDVISLSYIPDLVHAALDLLVDNEAGVWHVGNEGALPLSEIRERCSREAGLPQIARCIKSSKDPLNRALVSQRGVMMPTLESALTRYLRESEVDWTRNQAAE
jgi:dTDP-4-dehydrorhamnose reductase